MRAAQTRVLVFGFLAAALCSEQVMATYSSCLKDATSTFEEATGIDAGANAVGIAALGSGASAANAAGGTAAFSAQPFGNTGSLQNLANLNAGEKARCAQKAQEAMQEAQDCDRQYPQEAQQAQYAGSQLAKEMAPARDQCHLDSQTASDIGSQSGENMGALAQALGPMMQALGGGGGGGGGSEPPPPLPPLPGGGGATPLTPISPLPPSPTPAPGAVPSFLGITPTGQDPFDGAPDTVPDEIGLPDALENAERDGMNLGNEQQFLAGNPSNFTPEEELDELTQGAPGYDVTTSAPSSGSRLAANETGGADDHKGAGVGSTGDGSKGGGIGGGDSFPSLPSLSLPELPKLPGFGDDLAGAEGGGADFGAYPFNAGSSVTAKSFQHGVKSAGNPVRGDKKKVDPIVSTETLSGKQRRRLLASGSNNAAYVEESDPRSSLLLVLTSLLTVVGGVILRRRLG